MNTRAVGQGTRGMVAFNWPEYVRGAAAVAAGLALARSDMPEPVRLAGGSTAALATWWVVASIAAGAWVYDASRLTRWAWLRTLIPVEPRRWAHVTAGFDDTSETLRALFRSNGLTLDLYDEARMTEPSIRRAHASHPPPADAVRASPGRLPIADAALDVAFVIFAAHELRQHAEQVALFEELRRVVGARGRVVLVEHTLDIANLVVFGPGARHFYSLRHWREVTSQAGLVMVTERRMTPFVRALVLAPP